MTPELRVELGAMALAARTPPEHLCRLGFVDLEISTLYRTLRHLEQTGLLSSAWEPGAAGPARRVYELTDVGRTWLGSWAAGLAAYRGLIERFFGLYVPTTH
jgi:PadR family transcriptional regulator PadR